MYVYIYIHIYSFIYIYIYIYAYINVYTYVHIIISNYSRSRGVSHNLHCPRLDTEEQQRGWVVRGVYI